MKSPPNHSIANDKHLLRACHFFFLNDTATTEIYTLSLHDALPICPRRATRSMYGRASPCCGARSLSTTLDRKSTRLNSSHEWISDAVFCLKKQTQSRVTSLRRPPCRLRRRSASSAPP